MRPADHVSSDDLRLLLALARTGRMTTAAAMSGLDQTTLSRRIHRLERTLGATLVTRGSDGWELSTVGQAVVESAAPLDAIMRNVHDVVNGETDGASGSLRIAAPDGFGVSFVTPALAGVLTRHRGVSIELVTSTRPPSSRGAGYDLTISIGVPQGRRLSTELLTPYSLALYESHSYRSSHAPIEDLAGLRDHRLIFYVDSLLSVAELDLTRSFAGMRVGFGSTNVLAQLEATRQGAGIGLLPCFLGEPEPGLTRVLPTEVRFELQFFMSTRRESAASELTSLVRQALHHEVDLRRKDLVPLE